MKAIAALITVVAAVLGFGALQELWYYPAGTKPFLVGAFVAPASAFLLLAGVMLWRSGVNAKSTVLFAAVAMFAACIAATMLGVMGYLAMLLGVGASAIAMGWTWRSLRPDHL